MNADRPLVSFITVNYRTPHFIRHLLQGIEAAHLGFSYEYFVVDNGSHDETAQLVKEQFPWVKLITLPENKGLGAANNLALAEARGEYVMHLNPDLTIFSGELEKWLAWHQSASEVGISGPRIINPDGTDQDSCYRFHTLLTPLYRRTFFGKTWWGKKAIHHFLMKDSNRQVEQEVDWVLGAAMLIRKDLLDQIGGFDERFFLYFEDADLCRRAWKAGKRVMFTPAAKVVHYHQRESRTRFAWQIFTNKLARVHLASGIKFLLKYRGEEHPRMAVKRGA
jgi:N-acetylglucosaminyl-diphospho-decaprenol L-rhamnosyltransferase